MHYLWLKVLNNTNIKVCKLYVHQNKDCYYFNRNVTNNVHISTA